MLISLKNECDSESVSNQEIFHLASNFIINNKYSNSNTNNNNNENDHKKRKLEIENVVFKTMVYDKKNTNFESELNQRVLLDSNEEHIADLLYHQSQKENFSFICKY
jgi:hypothetical protein